MKRNNDCMHFIPRDVREEKLGLLPASAYICAARSGELSAVTGLLEIGVGMPPIFIRPFIPSKMCISQVHDVLGLHSSREASPASVIFKRFADFPRRSS